MDLDDIGHIEHPISYRRPRTTSNGGMNPMYTVKGRLHWVGVMMDWGWEGKLNPFLQFRDEVTNQFQYFLVRIAQMGALIRRTAYSGLLALDFHVGARSMIAMPHK